MSAYELPVPSESRQEMIAVIMGLREHDDFNGIIRRIAAPVLAAFLREEIENQRYDGGVDSEYLLYLAGEIERGFR